MTTQDDRSSQISMVRGTAAAVAPRGGDLKRIRGLRFRTPDFDLNIWREMAELGWIGIALAEEQGGIGFGMSEAVALSEELGRGLVPEPLIAASLSAELLAATGEETLLHDLLSGKALVATAWSGKPDAVLPTFEGKVGPRWAAMSGAASAYLLPEVSGKNLSLRLVQAEEVEVQRHSLQDGGTAITVSAAAGRGRVISANIQPAFACAFDHATLATSGYLLGLAERAFEITIDYLKVRKQFDQSLASFQALQHRAVDMKIQLTLCRASVEGAAAALDAGADDVARAMVVSRAKSRAADTAMLVAREAVQLHGAIGYTDEYDIGLFARKAMVMANQYGAAAAHRHRYATLSSDLAA